MILAQILLLTFLGYETCYSDDMTAAFKQKPENATTVIARFLCAVFLHIVMTDEIKQGFQMMKYANNHWWKFNDWSTAYMVGFCQMFIVVLVEVVNLAILNTNESILDIIMNFLALVVLSEFDNYFFQTIAKTTVFGKALSGDDNSGVDLETLLNIEVTTSRFAN